MDAEFSIVIPYHAIPETVDFVKRQLNYYHFNSTISMFVILAVSGDEIVKFELEHFIKKLNNQRFIFFTTNENNVKNIESFLEKIFNALKLVTTKYVVINAADDVIIPEVACKGTKILADNLSISGVKGYTVCYHYELGDFSFFKDLEILDDCPINRIKLAIDVEIRESFFYIMRRTIDLVREYKNILVLLKKSKIVRNSFYYVEHFKALSLVSLGKVYVLPYQWRLCNSHKNNSSTYAENVFIRMELGFLDKVNYEWFKKANKNIDHLSYRSYKFLCMRTQILNLGGTLEQLAYHIYKNCYSVTSAVIITIYFILYKIFFLLQLRKYFFNVTEVPNILENGEDFFETYHYELLRKYYFSENDIKLLDSKTKKVN